MAKAGMIMRQKEPMNLEMPFGQVCSFLTPVELFYIRSHFAEPDIDASTYELRIGGAVENPLVLNYRELRAMPAETRIAMLECAGNGRVFLVPPSEGAQWGLGAVGNAEWTGVSLRALLERAGIEKDACEIVLEGADRGTPKEKPVPPGKISYARSLARDKALGQEVLIAYQMNGRDLARAHGYPVRAIVPGHYGMASVKWLTQVQAICEPFRGYFQTSDYGYWDYLDGRPVRRALGEIGVKSQISRPDVHEAIAANEVYMIRGAAWAGESEVTEVSVSADGGQTWAQAEFIDPAQEYAWRRWEFKWRTPREAGTYTLLTRAADANGVGQPHQHDENFGSYAIHHILPVEVFVG